MRKDIDIAHVMLTLIVRLNYVLNAFEFKHLRNINSQSKFIYS